MVVKTLFWLIPDIEHTIPNGPSLLSVLESTDLASLLGRPRIWTIIEDPIDLAVKSHIAVRLSHDLSVE
jgi:hypothetical protein